MEFDFDLESSDFKTYLHNFHLVCHDPENHDVVNELMANAKSPDPADFKLFLEYNLYIFQNPQNITEILQAAILIMNSFRNSDFNEIKEKWYNDEVQEVRQKVKDIIISGLQNEDVSIRNVCSTIISLISYLEDSWAELCSMLVENIKTPDENFYLAVGSIRCVAEIFSFEIITPGIQIPDYMLDLIMLLVYAVGEQSLQVTTRIDACQAFIEISEQVPDTYDSEMIDIVLQSITQSLNEEDLYIHIFNLFLELVKKNYPNLDTPDNHIFSTINEIIHNEIADKSGFLKSVAINFLIQFANFEKDIDKHKFSTIAADEFVEQLLQCLIEIEDPQNDNPEDPTDITPHVTAVNALRSLFYHNSQVIFVNVKDFFEKFIGSENWIEVHAAIYSIYSLCGKDAKFGPSFSTVNEFINSIFQLIITHAGEKAMRLRTKETALWIISDIISTYNVIDEDNEDDVPQLLSLFESTMDTNFPRVIIGRSCKIFALVVRQCNKNFLDESFEEFVEIILSVGQDFQQSDRPSDINRPFVALVELIKNCSENCGEQIFELLNRLIESLQTEGYPPILMPSICITAAAIIKKIPEIVAPMAESLIQPFIRIIDVTTNEPESFNQDEAQFDTDIWENTFIVMANLIDLKAATNTSTVLLIMNSIINALILNKTSLAQIALRLLSKLYANVPPNIMNDYLEETLKICSYFLKTDFQENTLSFFPSVLVVYAEIFKGMGIQYIDFYKNEKHCEMLEMVRQAWENNYKSENFDDVLNLYINIVYAYKCLFQGFAANKQFLKIECKDSIFRYIKKIYDNVYKEQNDNNPDPENNDDEEETNDPDEDNSLYVQLLDQIYILLKQIGETLTTQINIMLNRKYVINLVKKGLRHRQVKEEAKFLLEYIPNL